MTSNLTNPFLNDSSIVEPFPNSSTKFVYQNVTLAEFRKLLGEAILVAVAQDGSEGAYDIAFTRPWIRAYYIAHYIISSVFGFLGLIGIYQVSSAWVQPLLQHFLLQRERLFKVYILR